MPIQSKRECPHPGCRTLTRGGTCEKHKVAPWQGAQRAPDTRGNASSRGYDYQWQRLRDVYIRNNPVCEIQTHCSNGPAIEVDHIRELSQGGARLDQDNLQSTCRRCHWHKTQAASRTA
jgi:5-methylcytosine-specific restriction protein A